MVRFLLVAFMLAASSSWAADPVYSLRGQPESRYDITQSTVSISSTTVSTDDSVRGYRAIYIFNESAATFYYRIDGSTEDIVGVGWPVEPDATEKIETNQDVHYLLINGGTSSIDVRKKVIRK